jgi:hypothetical protein
MTAGGAFKQRFNGMNQKFSIFQEGIPGSDREGEAERFQFNTR